MTNLDVYRKTFVFSWLRLLVDALALAVLAACIAVGALVTGGSAVGFAAGAGVGLIAFGVIVHYVSYLFKAGQIAMMTRCVVEDKAPDGIVEAGKAEVRSRFAAVTVYYMVTGAIKGIFGELARAVDSVGSAAGDVGSAVGGVLSAVIQTIVSYLSDCCLGWVFLKKDQGAFRSTCQGAVIFFKNWKSFLKNMARVLVIGVVSLVLIGGLLTVGFYRLLGSSPELVNAVSQALKDEAGETQMDPQTALWAASLLFAVLIWAILHSVFVRPFVLAGVLRNYLEAGIANPPAEDSFASLDKLSRKFRKAHDRADREGAPASASAAL